MLFLRKHLNLFLDGVLFVLIYLYLFQFFPLKYLLMETVITGGDTGSHYKTAVYLKEVLLPQGKIIGWYPGNYGGYPLFIMYFPLLYVLAVWLSYGGLSLLVSFKVMTILGPLLLPICTYAMVKLCRFRFPGPGLAACGSLLFLVNTSNSMWGGNLYSTLAGEFSYAVSFSLTFLFFGVLYRLVDQIRDEAESVNGKLLCVAIVLTALIGLSHGFTLIICGLASLFFLLTPRHFLAKGFLMLAVFGSGGLLMAGWFVQLFFNMPYTTAFNLIWTFASIWEVLPQILLLPLALFLLYSIYALIPERVKWQIMSWHERNVVLFLWFVIALCVLSYFSSETLKLPDIRFIPFVHYLVAVWGLAFFAIIFTNRFIARFLPFIGFFGCLVWASYFPTDATHWTRWNFRGFEKAPDWVIFRTINNHLAGNYQDPRVAYEHSTLTNSMGTIRAFESLPFFSGRPTLEGLYFQSSLLSPFVFYAQSLYSKNISCPFPDYPCSRFNLKRAVDYLHLMNVSQLILVSPEAKQMIRKLPAHFQLDNPIRFSKYEVWKLKHETGYVKVLSEEPLYIAPDNFRHKFYQWFRNYRQGKRFLYTVPKAYRWVHGLDQIPAPRPVASSGDGDPACAIEEEIGKESVQFQTRCLGKPHLVKVAYNPGWELEGAQGPYLISPAFMLVYPTENRVVLKYTNRGAKRIALFLTGLGVVIFGLILGVAFSPKWRKRLQRAHWLQWLHWPRLNWVGYGLFMLLFVGFMGIVVRGVLSPGYLSLFKIYERAYTAGDYATAQKGFAEIVERWPDQPINSQTYYFLGLAYYLEQKCTEAVAAFEQVFRYEDSEYLAEAYYHAGLCAQIRQRFAVAHQHYQHIINVLQDPVWSVHAKNRLKEIPQ